MSDTNLRDRLLNIKKELSMPYTTIGIYAGLSRNRANYAVSKYVTDDRYLPDYAKVRIDDFLTRLGY